MNRSWRRSAVVAFLLAAVTACLYLTRLHAAPIFLNRDEVFFALDAHSVATTGRDTFGRFMPLFFQMDDRRFGSPMWFQPMLIYAVAASLKVFPFSEWAIRLPMALAGVANVVLTYFVATLLFESELLAILAAALLALSPAHFIFSRVATDYQAPVPFILGWVLSLLLYFRARNPRLLAAAGLALGIGTFSYIAAYALMPLYLLLTCVILVQKREPVRRFWTVLGAFAAPVACALPFLIWHPNVIRDVTVRFQRIQPDPTSSLINMRRFIDAPEIYVGIWNPRLLFIDGPERTMHTTWLAGVFLLPVAALLVIGVARAIRRPLDTHSLLLLGGLVAAPIPASLVGEPEAVRRALAMLPFGVLLSVSGLHYFWTSENPRIRRIAFVVLWAVPIALASAYHDFFPHAQAIVRACSIPLAVAGLGVLLRNARFMRGDRTALTLSALAALACVQVGFVFVPGLTNTLSLALAALITIAVVRDGFRMGPMGSGMLLALVASEFLYVYVDYSARRVGPIPASILVMTLRTLSTGAVLAVVISLMDVIGRRPAGARDDAVTPLLWLIGTSLAYFYIDRFSNPALRFVHASAVLVAGIGLSVVLSTASDVLRLARVSCAAVALVACIQFGYFFADYLTDFQVRGSGSLEGNVGLAAEALLEHARNADVPSVQFGRITAGTELGEEYWKVYLIKHHRENLLPRTTRGPYQKFEPETARALPPGSYIVAAPSQETDRSIDALVASGEVTKQLIKAPDGTAIFWVLTRTAPPSSGRS